MQNGESFPHSFNICVKYCITTQSLTKFAAFSVLPAQVQNSAGQDFLGTLGQKLVLFTNQNSFPIFVIASVQKLISLLDITCSEHLTV